MAFDIVKSKSQVGIHDEYFLNQVLSDWVHQRSIVRRAIQNSFINKLGIVVVKGSLTKVGISNKNMLPID